MLFKSTLFGLALAAGIANAQVHLLFMKDANQQGKLSYCMSLEFQKCYRAPMLDASSMEFLNNNFGDRNQRKFSITLYSGANCNGQYDRWSFEQQDDGKDNMDWFPSLNDNVNSFKVANFLTSFVSGGNAGNNPETVAYPNCIAR